MFTRKVVAIAGAAMVSMMLASAADAGRVSVYVTPADLSTYSPADATLGDYYVLQFEVPDEIKGQPVRWAFLELFCDVSAKEMSGYLNEAPLIEVYALSSTFSGTLDPSQFEPQTLPLVRNVAAGLNRRVVIDITEIVKSYIKNPAKNHGLIIGSLKGRRDGLFSVKSNSLGSGAVAKITFLN